MLLDGRHQVVELVVGGDPELNPARAAAHAAARGVVGIVSMAALEKATADGLPNSKLMDLIEDKEFPHLHSDQALSVALDRLGSSRFDALPVVSRADVHQLEGIVTLQDVLNLYGFGGTVEEKPGG